MNKAKVSLVQLITMDPVVDYAVIKFSRVDLWKTLSPRAYIRTAICVELLVSFQPRTLMDVKKHQSAW